ncbi:MAG: hypothetical protein R3C17_21920, partial [Planctomycetaceae bacterium]
GYLGSLFGKSVAVVAPKSVAHLVAVALLVVAFVAAHFLPLSYPRIYASDAWHPDRSFVALVTELSRSRGGGLFTVILILANVCILAALCSLQLRRPAYVLRSVFASLILFACSAPIIFAVFISLLFFGDAGVQRVGSGIYVWCLSLVIFVVILLYNLLSGRLRSLRVTTDSRAK